MTRVHILNLPKPNDAEPCCNAFNIFYRGSSCFKHFKHAPQPEVQRLCLIQEFMKFHDLVFGHVPFEVWESRS